MTLFDSDSLHVEWNRFAELSQMMAAFCRDVELFKVCEQLLLDIGPRVHAVKEQWADIILAATAGKEWKRPVFDLYHAGFVRLPGWTAHEIAANAIIHLWKERTGVEPRNPDDADQELNFSEWLRLSDYLTIELSLLKKTTNNGTAEVTTKGNLRRCQLENTIRLKNYQFSTLEEWESLCWRFHDLYLRDSGIDLTICTIRSDGTNQAEDEKILGAVADWASDEHGELIGPHYKIMGQSGREFKRDCLFKLQGCPTDEYPEQFIIAANQAANLLFDLPQTVSEKLWGCQFVVMPSENCLLVGSCSAIGNEDFRRMRLRGPLELASIAPPFVTGCGLMIGGNSAGATSSETLNN